LTREDLGRSHVDVLRLLMRRYSLSILTRNGPVDGKPVGLACTGTLVWVVVVIAAESVVEAAVSVL